MEKSSAIKSCQPSKRQWAKLAYWDYLCKWFNYTPTDAQNICWAVLNSGFCSLQGWWSIINNTYSVHSQQAPTMHLQIPFPPGFSTVPILQHHQEGYWHFLKCDHQERCHLFEKLKQQLVESTSKHSLHPSILTIYWLGLLAVCTDTPYLEVQDDLPSVLCAVICYQNWLGWEHLYYGRLTKCWTATIYHLHPHTAASGTQINVYMTQAIRSYILATWHLCNQHLYQDTGHFSIPNYQQAVITAYEVGTQLPPAAQETLFNDDLTKCLSTSCCPMHMARTWAQIHETTVESRKLCAKINNQNTCSFFNPQPQSANVLHPP